MACRQSSLKLACRDDFTLHMDEACVRYTDGIGSWDVKLASLADHIAHLEENHNLPPSLQHTTRTEFLEHGMLCVPYFDFDETVEEAPTALQLAGAWESCEDAVRCIFGGDPSFNFSTQVAIAHRHGLVPSKQLHKLSFRIWVKGYKITPEHMTALISMCGVKEVFDTSIYSKRRLLAVVGGVKGGDDHRVLKCKDPAHVEWCICQRLEGQEQLLDMSLEVANNQLKGKQYGSATVCPDSWDDLVVRLELAGFRNPSFRGKRQEGYNFWSDNIGEDCPCCPGVHDSNQFWVCGAADGQLSVKNYSQHCRVMRLPPTNTVSSSACSSLNTALANWGVTALLTEGKDASDRECLRAIQHLEQCPTCSKRHTSDQWYLYKLVQSCWSFRNAAFDCRERLVLATGNAHLETILDNPNSDVDYVELFLSETKNMYAGDGKHVYKYEDHKWKQLTEYQVTTPLQDWLKRLLTELTALMCHEQSCMLYVKTTTRELQKVISQLKKAAANVSNEGALERLRRAFTRKVAREDFSRSLDSAPFLLGTEGGVVDLKGCVFRPGVPEDYVTMSVGYAWTETVDPEVEAQLEDFLAQIYPVPAEREFMQRYCGYCLTGQHESKLFLMLTDKRGGFNGKSTFLSLLRGCMGDYAIKSDAGVLYKQDKARGLNDHAGGLFAYEKKRLMVVEETDSSKVGSMHVLLLSC